MSLTISGWQIENPMRPPSSEFFSNEFKEFQLSRLSRLGDYSNFDVPLWIKIDANARLKEISSLQDDWDGCGAGAVDPMVMKFSGDFIDRFPISPTHIVPSANGTLLMEWVDQGGMGSLEFGIDGFSFYAAPKFGVPIYLMGHFSDLKLDDIYVALYSISSRAAPSIVEADASSGGL